MTTYFIESGRRRKGEQSTCLICEKIFFRRIKPIKGHKPQITCSVECRNILNKKRTIVQCKNCGKEIEKRISDLKKSKHSVFFCDRKCKDEAQRIGGCEEIQPPHYGTGYRNKLNIKTQKETGCECGVKEKYKLLIHHVDGNRNNNVDDNLEVVCANCHIKRHLKLINGVWIFDYKYLTPRELIKTIP